MNAGTNQLLSGVVLLCVLSTACALQCYQCDSNEDNSCPSWHWFDTDINAVVDCNSFEATTPGTFCMKITQQSPGWSGWKKVTRRCGSRSDTGVAWGCRWTYQENGVWKEVCYCEDRDGCNTASSLIATSTVVMAALTTLLLVVQRQG